ncbi:MAG TPA: DUF5711 family protein [Clostridia bacterium]|nr:DUF5711 family protein [Clostridia bacterium]
MKNKDGGSPDSQTEKSRIVTIRFDGKNDRNKDETAIVVKDGAAKRTKKKKPKKRRMILLALALLAVAFIYLNWDALSPQSIGQTFGDVFSGFEKSRYPVMLSQGNFIGAVPVGQNLGVLTDTSFLIYSSTGKPLAERQHGMSSPSVISSGNKAMIYDRGGKQYKVETRYSEVYSGQTDYPIITAAVSKSGYFALVTESDNYLSEILVYNQNGVNVFKYYSAEGRVLSVALSPDGSRIAAVTVGAKNGDIQSTVKIYKTSGRNEISSKSYDGLLLFSIGFKGNDRITAIGDTASIFLHNDGSSISRYDYQDKTLKCYSNTPWTTALVFSKYGVGSDSTVTSFGANGDVAGQTDIHSDVKSVYAGNKMVVALTQRGIWHSDTSLKNSATTNVSGDMIHTISIQNDVYIFGLQAVYQYKES